MSEVGEFDSKTIVNVVATFASIVPIAAGIYKFKTADKIYRQFLYFSIYWFLTDLLVGWLYKFDISIEGSRTLFLIYPVVESVFLFWFMKQTLKSPALKKLCTILVFIMPVLWIQTLGVFGIQIFANAGFNTIYQICVGFIAGYGILKFTEEYEDVFSRPVFWFYIGIFVYCFCTFFFTSLLDSGFARKFWFIYNIVDMFVYLIFAKAFWTIKK